MARGRENRRNNDKNKGDGWDGWGGYMKAKQQKLQEQYVKDGISSNIFKGVSIYVNGYTKPSSDELRRLIIQHGGVYQHYLYKTQVTHIIATSIASSKTKELKHMKIIKPEWITDSVAEGKILSYIPYQLYTSQTRIQTGMGGFAADTKTISTTLLKSPNQREYQPQDTNINIDKSPKTTVNQYRNFEDGTDNKEEIDSEHTDDDSILGQYFDDDDDESLVPVAIQKNSEQCLAIETEETLICTIEQDGSTNHKKLSNRLGSLNKNKSVSFSADLTDNSFNSSGHKGEADNIKPNVSSSLKPSVSPNKMAKAGDANFLSEFYGNSRLHHLSTWGAEYKAYVNKLQTENTDHFPGREKLRQFHVECVERTEELDNLQSVKGKPERIIMHVDMDCYFVSVGLLERPDLRGKPVAVTHSRNKGRTAPTQGSDPDYEMKYYRSKRADLGGTNTTSDTVKDEDNDVPPDLRKFDKFQSFAEIASCSYEARKAGVKNGMFMGPAKQLCPELNTIPYNFQKYQQISKQLYDTVASYTHDIEAVSCDEMLVDCTDLLADTGATPLEFATVLRQEIYNKTGCCASAGLASNILLAKFATRKAKPNGQFYLQNYDVIEFIKSQAARDIPGVGWSMNRKLSNLNVTTCGDLQNISLATLQKEFGPKTGQSLYKSCRGQDERPIKMEKERKSVSAEINYGIRFQKEHECVKFICDLSEEVHNRLVKVKLKGKVITLKVKVRKGDAPKEAAKFMGHGICNNVSKSITVPLATDDATCISKECISMLHAMKINIQDLRGMGIQMQRLEMEAGTTHNKNTKGNQSILNFTVAKTNTETIKQHSVESTVIDKPQSGSNQLKNNINARKDTKVTKVKSPSSIDINTYKDFHVDDEERNERNISSQPIVSKHRVTLMSGYTLVDELARRKTAKGFLPPLPTLPSFNTPDDKSPVSTTTSIKHDSPMDYFLSPSQVDPDVLSELPSDIREQIEKEMNSRKTKCDTDIIIHNSQEAGCSHWPGSMTSDLSIITSRSPEDDSPIVALPSPSQIDLDCLNALPRELQEELQFAYKQQPNHQTVVTHLQSPTKHCSPGKTRKTSPLFKVPKGRPGKKRKLSPKKLLFSYEKSKSLNKPEINKIREYDDDVISIEDDIIPTLEPDKHNDIDTVDDSVSLCGAVTISQVRSLLKEWLYTCQEPQEEDVDVITAYISQLILDQNLEQVDLVLKFMYRNILKLDNNLWKRSLYNIVNNTQSLIQSVHGSRLNVDYMNTCKINIKNQDYQTIVHMT